MQKYREVIQDRNGTAMAGVLVRVQTYPGAVDAVIYSDDGSTLATNPLTTGANGEFEFYAADGQYQLVVSGTGINTRTITDIQIEDVGDPSAGVFSSLSVTGTSTLSGAVTAGSTLSIAGSTTSSGQFLAADGDATTPSYAFTNDPDTGFYSYAANRLGIAVAGVPRANFDGQIWSITNSGGAFGINGDVFLFRDAANTLAQRNGTSGQSYRLYNTFTDSSNYERLAIHWNSNIARVWTESGGSGTNRTLQIGTNGVGALHLVANGARQVHVEPIASAVNYLDLRGNTAGGGVSIRAAGSDTNVSIWYVSKGTNSHSFFTGGSATDEQFRVAATTTAVNYVGVTGNIATASPALFVGGSDTNISLQIYSKGSGAIRFRTETGVSTQFEVAHTASAVNAIGVTGAVAGAGPRVFVDGSDANIQLRLHAKGTESVRVFTAGGADEQFRISHTASSVNFWQATGRAAGNGPTLIANGADANVSGNISVKGSGAIRFTTDGLGSSPQQFQVTHVASAVNYVEVRGGAAAAGASVRANGSDTNIELEHVSKGTGGHSFYTDGALVARQFRVEHIVSAVNYTRTGGSATGNAAYFAVAGSDTNIGLLLSSKGSGSVDILTEGTNTRQFRVAHTASAVNYLQVTGAATTGTPGFLAAGSDTDVNACIVAKGAGVIRFSTGSNVGTEQFRVAHTASAVNYIQATGGATGAPGNVTLSAQGSDSNVTLNVTSKGTGAININAGNAPGFSVNPTASAVNWVSVAGAAAGGTVSIAAAGSDTNVGLLVASKGSDSLELGTNVSTAQVHILHTASANRQITLTGSNGGNPTINTTAGSLAITPAVTMASTLNVTGQTNLATVVIGGASMPQNSQSANYTLVAADANKHIFHPAADTNNRTWTIPANSSVAYSIGTCVTFINDASANTISIAITSDTLVDTDGNTGTRTLAANGVATAVKVASTRWKISGVGLS